MGRLDWRKLGIAGIVVAACVIFANPAYAQYLYGVRVGISGGPDQFYVGGQVESPPLGHATTFRPNIEIGVGSNIKLVTVNLELVHWMPLPSSPWRLYAGGGAGANFAKSSDAFNSGRTGGLNVVFGLQHSDGVFAEVKTGIEPRVKIAVGYVFK